MTDIKPSVQAIYDSVGSFTSVNTFLRPNGFRFTIKDIANTAFTCQSIGIPAIQFGTATQPTPFVDIPRIGDKLVYNELAIKFLIAEDLSNYMEIFDWMVALGFPNDYNQFPRFVGERLTKFPFYKSEKNNAEVVGYSDGTLTILDSNNQPKTNIMFRDMYPVSLEGLNFDVTTPTVDYFIGAASFKYRSFDIEVL